MSFKRGLLGLKTRLALFEELLNLLQGSISLVNLLLMLSLLSQEELLELIVTLGRGPRLHKLAKLLSLQ